MYVAGPQVRATTAPNLLGTASLSARLAELRATLESLRRQLACAEGNVEFWRLSKVKIVTGYGRCAIYGLMEAGEFLFSVSLGERAVAWPSTAIIRWMIGRIERAIRRIEEKIRKGAELAESSAPPSAATNSSATRSHRRRRPKSTPQQGGAT
jgi:prophage regulatory protein